MDMLDVFALFGLEWLTDKIEDRYGRTVALLAAAGMMLAVIAALVALLFALI